LDLTIGRLRRPLAGQRHSVRQTHGRKLFHVLVFGRHNHLIMERLGPETRKLLQSLGLDRSEIESIETGDVEWDLVPAHEYGADGGDSDLVLTMSEGAQRLSARLSKETADKLINTWDFERRQRPKGVRPATFPVGSLDDWTGIKPDSDWLDLVREYRTSIDVLGRDLPRDASAPWLYLCRHTLELQLKAIIMLGQEAMALAYDLPSHHDLQKLWTAAYPIAKTCRGISDGELATVRQVVDDYHNADPGSFNFRYPVERNNKPVVHKTFVHAFSRKAHASVIREASDYLDDVIRKLRFTVLIRQARLRIASSAQHGAAEQGVAPVGRPRTAARR